MRIPINPMVKNATIRINQQKNLFQTLVIIKYKSLTKPF
jgi:hypothetical protein